MYNMSEDSKQALMSAAILTTSDGGNEEASINKTHFPKIFIDGYESYDSTINYYEEVRSDYEFSSNRLTILRVILLRVRLN